MELELLNFFVRGAPMPQPRPRVRVMHLHGKPVVQIYDQLRAYESVDGPRVRKAWDAERWRDRIMERTRAACAGVSGLPIDGPVRIDLDFYFDRPQRLLTSKAPTGKVPHVSRPDVDNLFKLVADAIGQAGWREVAGDTIKTPLVWGDDGQVCDSMVRKWYVARGDSAGVRIIVTRLEDPEPSLPGLVESAGAATRGGL